MEKTDRKEREKGGDSEKKDRRKKKPWSRQ